jgi:hypothetical protein
LTVSCRILATRVEQHTTAVLIPTVQLLRWPAWGVFLSWLAIISCVPAAAAADSNPLRDPPQPTPVGTGLAPSRHQVREDADTLEAEAPATALPPAERTGPDAADGVTEVADARAAAEHQRRRFLDTTKRLLEGAWARRAGRSLPPDPQEPTEGNNPSDGPPEETAVPAHRDAHTTAGAEEGQPVSHPLRLIVPANAARRPVLPAPPTVPPAEPAEPPQEPAKPQAVDEPQAAARPQPVADAPAPVQRKSPSKDKAAAAPENAAGPVVADSPSEPAGSPSRTAPTRHLRPSTPPLRLSPGMMALGSRIDRCLQFYRNRPLNTREDSPWSIIHSILGYGIDCPLAIDGPRGRRTNGIGWICWNNPCAGRQLLYLDNGRLRAREGPGYQGHPGQLLALLAQVRLKDDYPVRVDGQLLSIQDLIEEEQRTCEANIELTFKLISLSHYLPSDATWLNERGQTWSIPRLLQIEMAQPVNGATCGGTHRVMACGYAVYKRQRRGEPLDGQWARAHHYVRQYHRYAMSLQNRDGSFSSDWFRRRSDWGDMDRQLQTTGHMLEWLVFTLPRNELLDRRVVRSVNFLTNLMVQNRYHDWEVGPRGHALRALRLYHERLFEPGAEYEEMPIARR